MCGGAPGGQEVALGGGVLRPILVLRFVSMDVTPVRRVRHAGLSGSILILTSLVASKWPGLFLNCPFR